MTLSPADRAELLRNLGLAHPSAHSAASIRASLESRWLHPSPGGLAELSCAHWRQPLDPPDLSSVPADLFHIPHAYPTTSLQFHTAGLDARLAGYTELAHRAQPRSARESTSLQRAPASQAAGAFVRGKSSYFPFRPGGLGVGGGDDDDELLGGAAEAVVESMEKAFEKGRGQSAGQLVRTGGRSKGC